MRTSPVERPNDHVVDFMTDGQGHLRIRELMLQDNRGEISGVEHYEYRTPGSNDWRDLGCL